MEAVASSAALAGTPGLAPSAPKRASALPQAVAGLRPQRRVGFLFNHDHVHQIAHSAPIAFELSRAHPEISVSLLVSSGEQKDMLQTLGSRFPGHRCEWVELELKGGLAGLDALLGKFLPVRKIAMLRSNAQRFGSFDALVVPEKTSLLLRTHFGCKGLKLIHTRHGAGDRAVGFDGNSGQFDLVLLSGEKIRRRLQQAGELAPHYEIVGYPKFDAVNALAQQPVPLFDNGRPTVLYNPHCSAHLSSWYSMGRDILEYFYRSRQYNLVFAPHVMLFRRRLQISIDKFAVNFTRQLPRKYRDCEHMRIDLGSPACTDMSYTLGADIYLGDVSSQVCEFLVRPRPCVFTNSHRVTWQNDPCYAAWHLGPVFERVDQLPVQLESAVDTHGQYRAAQQAYFRDSFDLTEVPSARRAAAAVAGFVN